MVKILYYEVWNKHDGWQGPYFPTLEECREYIRGQVILSKEEYTKDTLKMTMKSSQKLTTLQNAA